MNKLKRLFKTVSIDVRVYRMTQIPAVSLGDLPYRVSQSAHGNEVCYEISDNGTFVHRSFLYRRLRVLSLLGKVGPAIGNCVTSEAYRGQSVYPKMIAKIATETLAAGKKEVFIIVNTDNIASIRGIEKAGFDLFATIKAKRFLLFYFDKTITRT